MTTMKALTPEGKTVMETFQKLLQVGYAIVLGLVAYIANQGLTKLDELDRRTVITERENAVQESRLSQLERQLNKESR